MLLMTYVKTGDDETWPLRQHRQHRLRSYWRLGRRFSSQTELARLQRFCSEPGSGSVSQTWLLTVVRVGLDHILDGGPAVCLIGLQEAANGAECRFAGRRPECEVRHPWQLFQSNLG